MAEEESAPQSEDFTGIDWPKPKDDPDEEPAEPWAKEEKGKSDE